MAIVLIQEENSTQVTQIIAEDVESAIWAYAHNACFRWDELDGVKLKRYPRNKRDIRWMEFAFDEEYLVVHHVYGNRFTAKWVTI